MCNSWLGVSGVLLTSKLLFNPDQRTTHTGKHVGVILILILKYLLVRMLV